MKSTIKGIRISALACAVPTQEVTTETLYEECGKKYTNRLLKSIGVKQIRRSVERQTSSDLGFVAAKKILTERNIDLSTIGLLVYVTQTPDYVMPATSCILQKRLGLSTDCATFDINNGCAGFVYGLQATCSLLKSINCDRALFIIGDTASPQPGAKVSVPFGDVTAAVLLEKDENASPLEFTLSTDGNGYLSLIRPGLIGRHRYCKSEEEIKEIWDVESLVLMNGAEVFDFSTSVVPEQINQFLYEHDWSVSDFDSVILHQANLLIVEQIAKKIGADMTKVPISLDRFGNTSGGSIPLTIVDRYGDSNDGEISLLMSGFGIGLMWGTASIRISSSGILPLIESDDYFEDGNLKNEQYD